MTYVCTCGEPATRVVTMSDPDRSGDRARLPLCARCSHAVVGALCLARAAGVRMRANETALERGVELADRLALAGLGEPPPRPTMPPCNGGIRRATLGCRHGESSSSVEHTCPFLVDVYDDERKCTCCDSCERDCADDI